MTHITGFLLAFAITSSLACEYIKYGPGHTICRFRKARCAMYKYGFTNAEKAAAVKEHNDFRLKVATGQLRGQPSASNMKELRWDEELARIAQRWADQCQFGHDSIRASHKYPKVGQNMYFGLTSNPNDISIPMKESIESWGKEALRPGFPRSFINPFRMRGGTGHYTQLVWGTSESIGCGYSAFKRGGGIAKLIVCNYGPSGNIMRTSMYEIGRPCAKCTHGCSRNYPGLCN